MTSISTLTSSRIGRLMAFAACTISVACSQETEIVGHVLNPEKVEATEQRRQSLKAPAGFRVSVFAEGLGKPRMLAVSPDGTVYVTRRVPGDVVLLQDRDGDGKAERRQVVAEKDDVHGIALDGNRVYLATVKEVYAADRKPDGSIGDLQMILRDLPDGGQHPNRTLGIHDGNLYVSVGSTCNACKETNQENATILRAPLGGGSRAVFARGLRNTIGFAWHPMTGELWGVDHNIDWLGDDVPKGELNRLTEGAHYGWPFVIEQSKINPAEKLPEGETAEEWKKKTTQPALLYTAHAAPMQMVFYTGDAFPQEYRSDAFVAMHGSWNRRPPSGYEVVRIHFENGKPVRFELFLQGFLIKDGERWTQFGRPAGMAVARDGALLIADDDNGVIYRIAYQR